MEHIRPLTFSELLGLAKTNEFVLLLDKENDVIHPYVRLIDGDKELIAESSGREFWADQYGDVWLAYEPLA